MTLLDHGQKVELDLNPKTHKVHLACGRYEANVAGIDAEDFPPSARRKRRPQVRHPGRVLKEAINQVVFAAAPDDTRPVLAGVLLKLANGTLTLAAADGFRLAVRTLDLPDGAPELQMIVPARTLTEVARLLPDAEDEQVTIDTTPNGNQVYFAFGKTEITSRLIDGQFPDYQRIIPPESKTNVDPVAPPISCEPQEPPPSSPETTRTSSASSARPSAENRRLALGTVLVKIHQRRNGRQRRPPRRQRRTATKPRSPSTAAT